MSNVKNKFPMHIDSSYFLKDGFIIFCDFQAMLVPVIPQSLTLSMFQALESHLSL